MDFEIMQEFEKNEYFELAKKIEALLIAAGEPISLGKIKGILKDPTVKEIKYALEILNAFYDQTKRSFHILEIAGGYQIYTRPEHSENISKLFNIRESKLTQSALETAAIVAYKQPTTKSEIEEIRGVSSDSPLKTLMDRNLIKITGRGEGPGRPVLYGTTNEFLRYFQLNSLSQLPPMEEISLFNYDQLNSEDYSEDTQDEASPKPPPENDE